MKKLLTVVLSLLPAVLFSQELTADTPAITSWSSEILAWVLIGLSTLLGILVRQGIPALNAYLKGLMHFRGAAVVADSFTQVAGATISELQKSLVDGVLTADELKEIKRVAKGVAIDKLKNLSGFAKENLGAWVDDQLDILVGKLLLRI